jgi:hypothetical protein
MANLTITVANMVPASDAQYETAYLAGGTLTRGMSVYLDSTTSTWKAADCDASAAAAGSAGIGICMSDCVSGQPCVVQVGGSLAFGAILTVGTIYVVSATAGLICPVADLTTNGRVTILGVASTTSNLVMRRWATGIALT